MPRCGGLNHVWLSFTTAAFIFAATVVQARPPEPTSTTKLPTSGGERAQFAAVDAWMQEFMAANKIPGGSLAIAVDGEIKLARGYGYADREAEEIDEGKLQLDDKILDVLKLRPPEGSGRDPWWYEVTRRNLLTHTGGWDRNRSGDPMFMDAEIVSAFGAKLPVQHQQVIGFQLLRGIDFQPGERFLYSNFGYCLLGRAIEQAAGISYEKYVSEQLFEPLGITSAHIGGSLHGERHEGEVRYYTVDNYRDLAVVGPQAGKRRVPGQYGGWNQPLLDSHSGWVMSSIDLAKFGMSLDAVDEGRSLRGKLLSPETAQAMFTAQTPFDHASAEKFPGYGFGWTVTRLNDTPLVMHNGALPCTASVLARLDNRIWFAALFNMDRTADGKWLSVGIERELGNRILSSIQGSD